MSPLDVAYTSEPFGAHDGSRPANGALMIPIGWFVDGVRSCTTMLPLVTHATALPVGDSAGAVSWPAAWPAAREKSRRSLPMCERPEWVVIAGVVPIARA